MSGAVAADPPHGPAAVDPRLVRHRETTAMLGMTIFVASWAMLFAALFFAYGVTRARALAWPPSDLPPLPLGAPALATVAIATACFALHRARRGSSRAGASGAPTVVTSVGFMLGWLALAGVGAGAFLAVQIAVWRALLAAGLRPESGTYASVFYGLTTFHALHVLVGLCGLGALAVKALRAARAGIEPGRLALRLWTVYFDMVAALWLLLFVGVYCL